ncbi:MAG: hypothetical protein Ct9H300mP14_03750 [Gammaproteobacteria bacterium]|nr:MAG: hypothetical protein Ct9H300mP14_03750 [Gammaproteobacteria bacterium]
MNRPLLSMSANPAFSTTRIGVLEWQRHDRRSELDVLGLCCEVTDIGERIRQNAIATTEMVLRNPRDVVTESVDFENFSSGSSMDITVGIGF